MLTARRRWIFAATLALAMVLPAPRGLALPSDPPPQVTGNLESLSYKLRTTAADGSSGAPQGPAPANGSGGCFQANGAQLSCVNPAGGVWNGVCYVSVFATTPAAAVVRYTESGFGGFHIIEDRPDAAGMTDWWKILAPPGVTTGAIVDCTSPDGVLIQRLWRESANPPPSAAELEQAARLLVGGTITAPEIGTFPGNIDSDDTEITGIVGYPTWFWAKNPGPGVAAPDTKTDSVQGYTLRATARLLDITYDTGDGETEHCHLGVEPIGNQRHEPAQPPDPPCGHTYTERGYYTITATTHVTVDWSGAGRSGTIPITVTRSGRFTVSEVQALIVPNPGDKP